MVSQADAERFRQAQVGIRRLVERDLDAMWANIWSKAPSGPTQPYVVRDMFLQAVPVLVNRYGEDAAAVAADWYEEQRLVAGVGGAFRAVTAPSPYMDAVDGTVRRAAGALWTPNPEAMLVAVKASSGKYVLAASRATIQRNVARDPRAAGWQRVTRAGACEFCRMLAGRGDVYMESTVHFASHGDCNCAAVPSWDQNAPEVDVDLYEASKRTSLMSPEEKERHNALIQRAIREYVRD